jgi:hypothetical protein
MTRTFFDLKQLEGAENRQVLKDSRKRDIAATITPELAAQFGKAYTLGRFASPELIASAAVAGISGVDDLYTNLQTQLLKQGVVPQQAIDKNKEQASNWSEFVNAKPGQVVTVTDPRTGKPVTLTVAGAPTAAITAVGQQPTGLRKRTAEEIKAQEERRKALEERVPVVDITSTADKALEFRGLQGPSSFQTPRSVGEGVATVFSAVGIPFHYAGAAISLMAPDQLEFVAKGVRGFTKTASLPLLSAGEFTYNLTSATLRDAWAAGLSDGNAWERFQMALDPRKIWSNIEGAYQSTTLVQVTNDIANGNLDVGGGFFVQGKTGERAQENWREYIGTVGEAAGIDPRTIYDPQQRLFYEQTFNQGMLAGEFLVDAKLTSRDSEVYQFASDLYDLGVRIGVDPSAYFAPEVALAKRFGVTAKVATDYVAARKAGKFEEAMRIATENAMDVKVAELLTDTERQNAIAKGVFTRHENVVYSGDKSFFDGKEVSTFVDVDDPAFLPNTANLFGEGLYVTDQAIVASTKGYNVPDALSWDDIDPNIQASIQEILPEGAFYGNTGINRGAAGVWKFDKSKLNVIDGEQILGPGNPAFDVLETEFKRQREISGGVIGSIPNVDQTILYQDMFGFTPEFFDGPTNTIEQFTDWINRYTAGQVSPSDIPMLFDEVARAKQRVVERFPQFAEWLKVRYNFTDSTIRELLPKLTEHFFQSLERRRDLGRLSPDRSFADNFNVVRSLNVPRTGRQLSSAVDDYTKPLVDVHMFLTDVGSGEANAQSILLDLLASDLETKGYVGQAVMGEMLANMVAPLTDNKYVKALLETDINDIATRSFLGQRMYTTDFYGSPMSIETSAVQKALVNAGFDGMSYAGGLRIGGAGEHTATVVWKPSKMDYTDILSGEKFPVNQAVNALDTADKYRIRAEEIQTLRETENGYRQAFGLMDEAPRTFEPNNLNMMRHTNAGRKTLQALADESNPVNIWRNFLKGKSPLAAIDLAKATTPDQVFKVLQDAVFSGDPAKNMRNLPNSGWRNWASDTGYMVKQNIDRYSRQTAMMPDSTYIPFDDPAVALQRADRVLQVSGVRGAERDAVLKKLFDALETNSSKDWDNFFEAANEKALTGRMQKAGWTKEEIKRFTSYRGKGSEVTRWTLEDLADDIPIEWFDEGDGPLRITQLLSGGGYMTDPAVLDELIRDLNPLVRAIRKITAGNPSVAKAIKAERALARGIETVIRDLAKPAALGAPLPIRYIMRVVPEEMLRIAFSGQFDNLGQYVAQIYSGHLNYDTFGNIIMDSKKAATLRAKLVDLQFEYAALASDTTGKTAARIKRFEKKYGTADELQAQIDELNTVINDSLPSAQRALSNNVKGYVENTYDPGTLKNYMERSQVQQVVTRRVGDPANISKKEKGMRSRWVTAQARDIAEMTVNEDYRAIAKALKTGDPAALEKVAQDLFDGPLRSVYDEYTKNVFRVKPNWDWNTIEAARSRVNEIRLDITQRTGLQPDILDVLAEGTLDGVSVMLQKADRVYEATNELKGLVREKLLDWADAPDQVPYYPDVRTNAKATRNANWMYSSFGAYTKTSAALARNPLWQQAFWQRIRELAPVMDADELVKLVDDTKGKIPDYINDSVNDSIDRARQAKGTLTRDEAEAVASDYAREVTDGLLFNAQNNRSYFGSRHQILFMFFDAYREQWQTWLKLMKSPRNLHAVDVLTRELKEFREPFSQEDNYVLHNDPTTNKQVITVPFSNWVYKLMGGDAQLTIPTRNLSLVGSVAPGFSPVITIAASSWKPQSKTWANLKTTLFPFATGDSSLDPRDYFIPQFIQLFAQGGAGAGRQVLPQGDTFWNLLEKAAGPIAEKTKKASLIPIMRQLSADIDKYPPGEEGRKRLLEDAENLSNNFSIVRSWARAFLPAASLTQYYAQTDKGKILQGVLLDDIRKTENEVFAKGGTLTQAVNILLDRYGLGLWSFFGSGSKSNIPGLQPTKEYQNWVFENEGLLEKYPFAGGYLGPQDGEYNNRIFIQQSLIGQRTPKDPVTSVQEAENLLADLWYDNQVASIPEEWSNTNQASQFRAQVEYEVLQRFPNWNRLTPVGPAQTKNFNQIRDIEKMIEDPQVMALPAGPALKEYMDLRTDSIQKMIDFAPGEINMGNWTTLKASYSLRQYLFDTGNAMAERNPDFGSLWNNVLVKEFDTKDLKVPVEVAP